MISAPQGLPEDRYQRMRRTLNRRRLQVLLRQAIRGCFRRFRALRGTRFRLTR